MGDGVRNIGVRVKKCWYGYRSSLNFHWRRLNETLGLRYLTQGRGRRRQKNAPRSLFKNKKRAKLFSAYWKEWVCLQWKEWVLLRTNLEEEHTLKDNTQTKSKCWKFSERSIFYDITIVKFINYGSCASHFSLPGIRPLIRCVKVATKKIDFLKRGKKTL